MKRKATAVWNGSGKEGKGTLTTQSTALENMQYSYLSRFEQGVGTNPEELIAAAHAGCFTMALAFQLQGAGYTADELATEAAVELVQEGDGFRVSASRLTLAAKVPGISREKFGELAGIAEKNCPISKVLNAEITLDWTLS